ncbi:MAG: EamA family transporter, partial [Limnobacter sp.]|nr:EamA family transporter [Limnobacter sp.]
MNLKTASLTALTMCAFAANSFLCRAALDTGQIDLASFTALRLISGALMLCACVYFQSRTLVVK